MTPRARARSVAAALAAGSLVAGYAVAAATGVRWLGGLVLVVAAVVCARLWARLCGVPTSVVLVLAYAGGFVASHPLARVVGAWPAVLAVAAAVGAASLAGTARGRDG